MMIAMLLLLILERGTVSAGWSVTFKNPDPCAIKGSSVEFRCSYNYTDEETVISTSWYKGQLKGGSWKRVKLADLPSYHNRSEYLGDLQHDCSLAIHDLQDNDTGYYYLRFDTDRFGRRSQQSVHLSVTEPRVHPDTVRAGDNVTLECTTSCQLPTIWFKDGRPVAKPVFKARIEDAVNYVCAVGGLEWMLSDTVVLNVQYPPLNVSVEVSYVGLLTVGSSVNLTCNSAANPAADHYTWYRGNISGFSFMLQVGSGQVLSIPSMEASHNGLYLCQARNRLGENNSTEVLLTVDETDNPPLNVSVEVSYVGLLTVGSSVNLTCNSAANPAADHYTWYRGTVSGFSSMLQVGSGQVLSIPSMETSHNGLYLCQARNRLGENNSTEVLLTVEETDMNLSVLLVGIGIVVVVLLLTLVAIWAWRQRRKSAVGKEENSHDYENVPAHD